MIKKFFKKLFCRHKRKKQIERYRMINERMHIRYGQECKECGKVWFSDTRMG